MVSFKPQMLGERPPVPTGEKAGMGPKVGLDVVVKRKSLFCPYWELNPGCPACSLVTILTLSTLAQKVNLSLCLTKQHAMKMYSVLN